MLFFALLCPVLVWPLWRTVRRFGFEPNLFVLVSLVAFLASLLAGTGIAALVGHPAPMYLVPILALLAVTGIYHVAGRARSPQEVAAAVARRTAEEAAAAQTLADWDRIYREWICVKTYTSAGQQHEYLADRDTLEAADIRFTTKQAGITTLFVHPEDAERACAALGSEPDVADAVPGEGGPPDPQPGR